MERVGPGAFEGERLRRSGTWAILYLADWCPFCRDFAPTFEAAAGSGAFQIATADLTDEDSPLWDIFRIDVVPTIIAFREGKIIFRRDGRLGRGLAPPDVTALKAAISAP
jgi:thioredoxin 1